MASTGFCFPFDPNAAEGARSLAICEKALADCGARAPWSSFLTVLTHLADKSQIFSHISWLLRYPQPYQGSRCQTVSLVESVQLAMDHNTLDEEQLRGKHFMGMSSFAPNALSPGELSL